MDFSESTKPLAENIIAQCLPFVKEVTWTNEDDESLSLDIDHGIDLICICRQGQLLTFGVKVLTQNYTSHTVEDTSISKDGEEKQGDWYTSKSMYSLIIYSFDGINIERWAILDNGRLAMASNMWNLNWSRRKNNHSYSSFRYLEFEHILEWANGAVIYYGGDWGVDLYSRKVDLR